MSRSRRKTPVTGFTSAESEKAFKKQSNHKLRARAKVKMADGEFDDLPRRPRDVENPWNGPKDGKTWWRTKGPSRMTEEEWKEYRRKGLQK